VVGGGYSVGLGFVCRWGWRMESTGGQDVNGTEITWVALVRTDNEDSVALVRLWPGRRQWRCRPSCHDCGGG
jgi:hypothetical protein